jgi:hypothetical protein
MNKLVQRILVSASILPALAGAIALNAAEAEAAANRTCRVGPFLPVLCPAINTAGVQEGAASAQDQPVVDFLGVADTLNNGATGTCRAVAVYPSTTVSTVSTAGLPLNVSAYPAASAAGWYAEPAFPMTAVQVSCL